MLYIIEERKIKMAGEQDVFDEKLLALIKDVGECYYKKGWEDAIERIKEAADSLEETKLGKG